MLKGTREKPRKGQTVGDLKTEGIATLWAKQRAALVAQPFGVLTPMGGSFNFDPRGAWTAIDAGYSPNDQGHRVVASPVVELLAAWGLQYTRPVTWPAWQVRYAVWRERIPVELARVALQGALPHLDRRLFRFELALSGKNKVITFAHEEILP
jgi:CRISPR-associated protein Csx14